MVRRYKYDERIGRCVEIPIENNIEPVSAHVWPDIPEYRSPIDGRVISGRAARREDLIRNGCVEYDGPRRVVGAGIQR